MTIHQRWFRISHPRPQARLRLFCFPYAGGAASVYRTWPQQLPAEIELCAVQLPGRENRIREAPFSDAQELSQALLPALLPYLDKPFALFGHSMGSLLAHEVAQQLVQMGRSPAYLLVSGRRAPWLPDPENLLHTLATDEAFLTELQRRYNNLPDVIFTDPELRELFVPLLRADFTLVERYYCAGPTPLPCPIVAFGGADDARTSQAELLAWRESTGADFALHLFPGGHFYLNEQSAPLLTTIVTYLAKPARLGHSRMLSESMAASIQP